MAASRLSCALLAVVVLVACAATASASLRASKAKILSGSRARFMSTARMEVIYGCPSGFCDPTPAFNAPAPYDCSCSLNDRHPNCGCAQATVIPSAPLPVLSLNECQPNVYGVTPGNCMASAASQLCQNPNSGCMPAPAAPCVGQEICLQEAQIAPCACQQMAPSPCVCADDMSFCEQPNACVMYAQECQLHPVCQQQQQQQPQPTAAPQVPEPTAPVIDEAQQKHANEMEQKQQQHKEEEEKRTHVVNQVAEAAQKAVEQVAKAQEQVQKSTIHSHVLELESSHSAMETEKQMELEQKEQQLQELREKMEAMEEEKNKVQDQNCELGPMSDWGPCVSENGTQANVTCGGGVRIRSRPILKPQAGNGTACPPEHELMEMEKCNTQPCPVDCEVGEWGPWEPCSVTCGAGGVRLRHRSILRNASNEGKACEPLEEQGTCPVVMCPVDCKTSDWSSYTACTKSCGKGYRTRTRSVLVKDEYGGQPCGELVDIVRCNPQPCPVDCIVNDWGGWSGCSKTCGGGVQTRNRTVKTSNSYGGKRCPYLVDERVCSPDPCPVDCMVSNWTDWSQCSRTCGGGVKTRTRTVVRPNSHTGSECPILTDQVPCNTQSCMIDCEVGDWRDWGVCSKTCGGGIQSRTRIIRHAPQNGGAACPMLQEQRDCNNLPCTGAAQRPDAAQLLAKQQGAINQDQLLAAAVPLPGAPEAAIPAGAAGAADADAAAAAAAAAGAVLPDAGAVAPGADEPAAAGFFLF